MALATCIEGMFIGDHSIGLLGRGGGGVPRQQKHDPNEEKVFTHLSTDVLFFRTGSRRSMF